MKEKAASIGQYYQKKIKQSIFVIGFILACIGSAQVYHGQYSSFIKEFSVIIFSVARLFLFLPTVPITQETNIAYELAVWIAPIGSVLGLLTLFKRVYHKIRLAFFHRKTGAITVFGANDNARSFMKSLLKNQPQIRLICVMDKESKEIVDELEGLKIKTCVIDYTMGSNYSNRQWLKDAKVDQSTRFVTFEEEPLVYGHLSVLYELLKEDQTARTVWLNSSETEVREMVQFQMDEMELFDIRYFSENELIVRDLFENEHFSLYRPKMFEKVWKDPLSFTDWQSIDEVVAPVHCLLVGLDTLGEETLRQISNTGTVRVGQKIKITCSDENIEKKFRIYDAKIRNLDHVMDFYCIPEQIYSADWFRHLQKRHQQHPFTAVIFTVGDVRESSMAIGRIRRFLPAEVPIGIYAPQPNENQPLMDAVIKRYGGVVFYGKKSDLLNFDVVMNESKTQEAMLFNAQYNDTAAKLMGWDLQAESKEDAWRNLSAIKKQSSLDQANHRETKKDILSALAKNTNQDEREWIEQWRRQLNGKTVKEQIAIIEKDPWMNYMTALEHRRWNHFYYMKDFVFSTIKSEENKTHDCLIDDWDEFLASIQRDKAIYDFISTLSLWKETETIDEIH